MLMKATPIIYPESDGKPMADNTKQLRWIVLLYTGIAGLFRDEKDVFVAGNLNWYPVEGFPEIVNAPDVMVVFGRPKGDRGSYKQWEEDDVPPQVVFEVLSPGNSYLEMEIKLDRYEDHGVEEYYVYDPDNNRLRVYLREGDIFRRLRKVDGFVSPRLKIRFDLTGPEMVVFGPDGRRFLTPEESEEERGRERRLRLDAEKQRDEWTLKHDDATRRLDRLAELTRKLLAGQASDEEKAELTRLTAHTT